MDSQIVSNFVNQILNLWIIPELNFRGLPHSFDKVQIIFSIDGHKTIRINDEVNAIITTNKRKLEEISASLEDDESIEKIDRIPSEVEFGHFTLVKIRDIWVLAFDFRYSFESSKKLLVVGDEYLAASMEMFKQQKYRASVSNLYVAMENIGKAKIFLYPDKEIRKAVKHGVIASKINIFSRSNLIDKEFVESFNLVQSLNDRARYEMEFKIDRVALKECIHNAINMKEKVIEIYVSVHATSLKENS